MLLSQIAEVLLIISLHNGGDACEVHFAILVLELLRLCTIRLLWLLTCFLLLVDFFVSNRYQLAFNVLQVGETFLNHQLFKEPQLLNFENLPLAILNLFSLLIRNQELVGKLLETEVPDQDPINRIFSVFSELLNVNLLERLVFGINLQVIFKHRTKVNSIEVLDFHPLFNFVGITHADFQGWSEFLFAFLAFEDDILFKLL